MVKKTKKNRFNKDLNVDIVYSSNTIADVDPTNNLAELNISEEKAEELQKIRAKLPTFSSSTPLENELAKLPNEKPFRAFVYNVPFTASEADIEKFFSPLEVTGIDIVSNDSGYRGFCFVDFATRNDLAKALERTDCTLAGRNVVVRIADQNNARTGGFGRDRNNFSGGWRGGSFERRSTGGYRPAALGDDAGSAGRQFAQNSPWKRGAVIGAESSFAPRSQPFNSRPVGAGGPPRLQLQPRTFPRDSGEISTRNQKIFGQAKPVDTTAKEREIEQRLAGAQ